MCCSFLHEGGARSNRQFTVPGTTFSIKYYNSQTQTKKADVAFKRHVGREIITAKCLRYSQRLLQWQLLNWTEKQIKYFKTPVHQQLQF